MSPHRWYVVYAKPQREEYAQFHLRHKGFETFFPKLLLPQSVRQRRSVVPLFPNYLFAYLRIPEDYDHARWSPGVKHIVNFNGVPAPLDEGTVEFIRQKATPDGTLTARSNLAVGSEVRILHGPFEGLLGVIENPPDARGRVKVLLQLLSRQIRVDLPAHCMDRGWTVDEQSRLGENQCSGD